MGEDTRDSVSLSEYWGMYPRPIAIDVLAPEHSQIFASVQTPQDWRL